jgi:nucleotide-binding universal stress UspA family protein
MYRNILVPINPAHGEVGARILAVARQLVDEDGHITVLTVVEPLPGYISNYVSDDALESNKQEAVESLEQLLLESGVSGTAMLREGSPASKILEVAETIGADAIILGSHRPDFTTFLIGSTAARVVRHADCTVIVERSGS